MLQRYYRTLPLSFVVRKSYVRYRIVEYRWTNMCVSVCLQHHLLNNMLLLFIRALWFFLLQYNLPPELKKDEKKNEVESRRDGTLCASNKGEATTKVAGEDTNGVKLRSGTPFNKVNATNLHFQLCSIQFSQQILVYIYVLNKRNKKAWGHLLGILFSPLYPCIKALNYSWWAKQPSHIVCRCSYWLF